MYTTWVKGGLGHGELGGEEVGWGGGLHREDTFTAWENFRELENFSRGRGGLQEIGSTGVEVGEGEGL